MPAGLEVLNDYGLQIIDENYVCLALRASGHGVGGPISGEYNQGYLTFFDVSYSGSDTPVLVLHKPQQGGRGDVGAGVWGARRYDNGSWTFRIAVLGDPNFGAVDGGCDWYIFDRPPVSEGAGFGVEVFNGAGQIVFSSMFRTMKVASATSLSGLPNGKYGFSEGLNVSVDNQTIESDPDSHGNRQFSDIHRVSYFASYCASDGIHQAFAQFSGDGHFDYPMSGDLSGGGSAGNFATNLNGM